ncbi:class I SAM-dependent methyltransferase [Rossellomorea vietnamensis]|uniref:Class I SAM-dependent methyltransferase n=1 Tax=Rossellomorea vietnamensis TaxID=218284 RepID=A0A5D4KI55_9BACI|nr:class I SAM-dependent methyltransferase [Rossellomorea vietnamensis]TYR76954.1 class I SAM-dependent methyltransferase [Rossellomorea vietnamensis]
MTVSPIENLFNVLDDTALILQEELSCTYLEAIAESGENLFHGDILQDELTELTKKRLQKKYSDAGLESMEKEQIRKAMQLAILKGMKESSQPNHQMTPDAIGMFLSYLTGKFTKGSGDLRLLDPAIGTGNLLTTVLNGLADKKVSSVGVDVDDLLVKLAYIGANLQKHPLELFNQDSLEPLFIDPVDLVISDLPVGYYPNDLRAADYELKSDKGHAYSHHLFIEQSVKHTKPGGYLFFLVPNHLFESEEAKKLHGYFKKHVYIQGLLQLPMSLFKNEHSAKSILILQKKKEDVKPPKEVLMANMPSLSNPKAMENMLAKMDQWFKENK